MILYTLLFSIFVNLSTEAVVASMPCTSSCEAPKPNTINVQYPFSCSNGSLIQLNCSEKENIKIGEFVIKNLTDEHILIDLPASCNRSVDVLQFFQKEYYAVSSRNILLLDDCTPPPTNCMLPPKLVLGLEGCDRVNSGSDNISCFSYYNRSDYETVNKCKLLLSSIAVDADSSNVSSEVALDFRTLELDWWLVGDCNCDVNADCVNLTKHNASGDKRYRCRCKEGFVGDGFAVNGCRISNCSDSNFIGQCGGSTKVGFLIGGVFAGALLMAAIASIWYCIHRKSKYLKNQRSAKHLLGEASGNSSVPFFPYKEIDRATNGFSENKRLGTGAYGTVYAGKLHNDELVAIKKMRHRDPESIQQVVNEIKLLSSVSHPNLVRLLGCSLENDEQILVYEFMPNGTLSQHLQRERGPGLPWTVRLTIAAETAHAIAHLHTATNPPIYHRDIKSSNILLDDSFNSKVADFGLSRFGMMDDSHISTAPQGTPGYVDPQYHQNYHLSDKSDVYSFGVVLVEIIAALKVVDFSRPHSEINLAALAIDRIGKGRVDEIIDPFLEPHRDAWTLTSVHRVAELAFRCLAFHRDMRPSMIEVADELEQIRLSGWAPLDENICTTSSMASTCSSPYTASEISLSSSISKKKAIGSRRSIVPVKAGDSMPKMKELKESSPVSVQDPWLSEQSSPSSNSLLGNAV